MSNIQAGGAIETAIQQAMARHAVTLGDTALLLVAAERAPATGRLVGWRGQCGIGMDNDAARALSIAPDDAQHPVVQTALAQQPTSGTSTSLLAGLLHWCGVPLTLGTLTVAVVLATASEPLTASQQGVVERLAATITAILIGADAALHERRDSDQLALLMRYAANPIVLSDATSIIDLNAPAARLFDVSLAPDAEDQNEQINTVARNLARLSAFLAEPFTDESHTGELHLQDPHSHEELVMAIASSHVPEALGGASGTVSVLHDLTRARELEDHRVREQLFESEKLAATGRLAASIAHEINNPLEAIKNALYLLVARADANDPDFRFLALAQRETERVARIVRQMLGVARPSVAVAPIDVNEVVGEALQLLEPQLRQSRATLTVNLDDALPRVRASADQLKQVFLNLLLNAKDAMPNGGGLLVQTRIAHEGDSEFLAGRHIIIRIRDDGAGIDPDILPRVFEPFFSTKSERQGTGLGLWVCQDIIHHHGGQILVRSMVGRGTTFLVALPFITENEQGASNP
ncbi:MAG: hypothetical protein H0X24_16820 [Ktedonobacterales bacterium]|nr:hypothetical protein [Ktedonobacterales bacterium]